MTQIPQPFDQAVVKRNSGVFNLNYTNQDFYSMKTRLVNFINERFGENGTVIPNTFNDFVEGDIAIMLIENWAFLADTLSFKIDQTSNEIFIDTVTEIENAFRLSKLVGFNPQPPIAATSLWSATITNPLSQTLTISTPFRVNVPGNIPITIELFQANSKNEPIFDQDIVIPAGSLTNTAIIGLEGRTVSDTFTGTGSPNQSVKLTSNPVIYDSIRVEVDGMRWQEVDFFTDSNPRMEYRVEFDSNYVAFIIFGNNRAGMIPSNGSKILATYRVGGGVAGNIVTGFVNTQTQGLTPDAIPYPVQLRNYTKGQYGYNGDNIDDIKRKLPLYLKTQDRIVTGEDYQILSNQFVTPYYGQIGKSTAVLRNHGCAGNIIDIYVLAKNGTDGLQEAGNDLKVALNDSITNKKMLTDFVCIKNGVVVNVDIQIDVTLSRLFRKNEIEIRTNIQNAVSEFFSLSNWEYGQTLRDADIIKALSNITSITALSIHLNTSDPNNSGSIVTTKFYEIIRPDVINISFTYD